MATKLNTPTSEQTAKSRNKLNGSIKTMGVSLSKEQFDLLKAYSNKTMQTVSKVLMDSVNWDEIKETLE